MCVCLSPSVVMYSVQMCLFWAKHNMDQVLWDKHEGDGKILTPGQSMASGFSAACLGPVATGPFDVIKTRLMAQSKTGTIKYKVGESCTGLLLHTGVLNRP